MNTGIHPYSLPIPTEHGLFVAHYSDAGLAGLNFPFEQAALTTTSVPVAVASWHALAFAAVKAMLAGNTPEELPPFVPAGTDFQQAVWRELRRIPPGETRSYAQIAAAVGKPGAVRAAGSANGANNVAVLIPCHRVIRSDGTLGGYAYGLEIKRKLLAKEGAIDEDLL